MTKASLVALGTTLALLGSAIGVRPVEARSDYIPRTERGRLAEQIVLRWSTEAATRHETTPLGWAGAMASAFARAPLDQLRQAARATSFDELHDSFGTASVGTLATGDLVFRTIPPCRIVNTRLIGSTGAKLLRNTTRTFKGQILSTSTATFKAQGGHDSKCGIPDEAVALALQVLAARPEGDGHLTVFPEGTIVPMASSLNYQPLQNVSNELPMRMVAGTGGKTFNVFTNVNTHFVADVVGYFMAPQATALDCVTLPSEPVDLDPAEIGTATPPSCDTAAFYTDVDMQCAGPLAPDLFLTFVSPLGCSMHNKGIVRRSFTAYRKCCRLPGR